MATSRDFYARRSLPPRSTGASVGVEIADMTDWLETEAMHAGFVLDWAAVAIDTDINQIDTQSIAGSYSIDKYTTITISVRGVKAD